LRRDGVVGGRQERAAQQRQQVAARAAAARVGGGVGEGPGGKRGAAAAAAGAVAEGAALREVAGGKLLVQQQAAAPFDRLVSDILLFGCGFGVWFGVCVVLCMIFLGREGCEDAELGDLYSVNAVLLLNPCASANHARCCSLTSFRAASRASSCRQCTPAWCMAADGISSSLGVWFGDGVGWRWLIGMFW